MNRQTRPHQIASAAPVDCDVFIIECGYTPPAGKLVTYFPERGTERCNRADTVSDIVSGQVEDVTRVIKFCTATFSCEDVTKDIMRDAMSSIHNDGSELTRDQRGLFEQHLGVATVAQAERELVA